MSFRTFGRALWILSVLFILYLAVMASLGRLAEISLIGDLLTRPNPVVQATAGLVIFAFSSILLQLAIKNGAIRREEKALSTFTYEINNVRPDQYKPKALANPNAPRALRRLDLIMESRGRDDDSSLHEGLPAAAALDAGAPSAGYVPLQIYAWVLPVLGFIGTASGMAHAIAGFSQVLRDQQVEVASVAGSLSRTVIPELAEAFEATILALSATLIVYVCTGALKSRDQRALHQLDQLCVLLLLRVPQPPTPDGKQLIALLTQISNDLQALNRLPAAFGEASAVLGNASAEIRAAAGGFASTSNGLTSAAETIAVAATTLASASNESASAAAAIHKAAEELKVGEDLASALKANADLSSAIEEVRKEVLRPITITVSRGGDQQQ